MNVVGKPYLEILDFALNLAEGALVSERISINIANGEDKNQAIANLEKREAIRDELHSAVKNELKDKHE